MASMELERRRKWLRAAIREAKRRANTIKGETAGYGGEVEKLHALAVETLDYLSRISL